MAARLSQIATASCLLDSHMAGVVDGFRWALLSGAQPEFMAPGPRVRRIRCRRTHRLGNAGWCSSGILSRTFARCDMNDIAIWVVNLPDLDIRSLF